MVGDLLYICNAKNFFNKYMHIIILFRFCLRDSSGSFVKGAISEFVKSPSLI